MLSAVNYVPREAGQGLAGDLSLWPVPCHAQTLESVRSHFGATCKDVQSYKQTHKAADCGIPEWCPQLLLSTRSLCVEH